MRRVILESPYGSTDPAVVAENVAYARRCINDCLKRSEAPIASHLLYTQPGVLNDHDAVERELGINAGLAWLTVAEAVVVYTDRGISAGMHNAIHEATRAGTLIEYRTIGARP